MSTSELRSRAVRLALLAPLLMCAPGTQNRAIAETATKAALPPITLMEAEAEDIKKLLAILAEQSSAPLDPMHFCYYAGKPFGRGAVFQGQTCSTPGEGMVIGGTPTPLEWTEASRIVP